MKALKNKVSITLDPEILDKTREMAERDDRSLSQFINIVLRRYIEGQAEDIEISRQPK